MITVMVAKMTRSGWTEEQLMALPDIGHKYELIEGRLAAATAGAYHADLGTRIGAAVMGFALHGRLGWVLAANTGFWMRSGNLRCPDVSVVLRSRFPGQKRITMKFVQGAPDLAVEIVSPSDTMDAMHDRVVEYFDNGTRLAWVIDPAAETALVYRDDARPSGLITVDGVLNGDPILPGFTYAMRDLFEVWE